MNKQEQQRYDQLKREVCVECPSLLCVDTYKGRLVITDTDNVFKLNQPIDECPMRTK